MAPRSFIAVTGFGKFNGVPTNPTTLIVDALQALKESGNLPESLQSSLVFLRVVETSMEGVDQVVNDISAAFESAGAGPDDACFSIHFGVQAMVSRIHLEHQAYNEASFRVPDERGNTPNGVEIVASDSSIRCTRIDINSLRQFMCSPSLASETTSTNLTESQVCISADPGRFVCNYIYFKSLNAQATANKLFHESQINKEGIQARPRDSLFVHVPPFDGISQEEQMVFVLALLVRLATQGADAMHALAPAPLAVPEKGASSFYDSNSQKKKQVQPPPPADAAIASATDNLSDAVVSMVEQLEGMGFPRELAVQAARHSPNLDTALALLLGESTTDAPASASADAIPHSPSSFSPVKFVLCVRSDLKMSTGKIAAQCCHATAAMERDAAVAIGSGSGADAGSSYREWRGGIHGEAKIVLAVPDAATLNSVEKGARSLGVKTFRVQDAGRTEVAPGTVTVLGIGPVKANVIDSVTGKLSLLK